MPIFLLKYLPYIAGFLVVFGAGAWTGNALNPYQGRYQALQAADAVERMQEAEAVRKALQTQQVQAQKTDQTNSQVLHELQLKNTAIAIDRDHTNVLVRRLLARAARPCPASGGMPETTDQPGTARASGTSGDGQVESLLGDAYDESQRNAARLDALIAQIKPQL
jgi:hypothetical protein